MALLLYHLWWREYPKLRRLAVPYWNLPDASGVFFDTAAVRLPPLEQIVLPLQTFPMLGHSNPLLLDEIAPKHPSSPLKIVQVHGCFTLHTQNAFVNSLQINDPCRVELHSITLDAFWAFDQQSSENASNRWYILQKAVDGSLWNAPSVRHRDIRPELYYGSEFRLDLGSVYVPQAMLDMIKEE